MKSSHAALAVVGLALAGLWYAGGGTVAPAAAASEARVAAPLSHDNLTVYFVHGPNAVPDAHKVATLQEAIDAGWAVVHETGDVNTLAVENRSPDTELFVQEGDMIKGGRQDRVIATDMLVPPKSGVVPFPAHCVEQGRWSGRGGEAATHFNKSDQFAAGKAIRYANASGQQSEVWAGVKDQQTKLSGNLGVTVNAAASETSLQLALENKAVQDRVAGFEQALRGAGEGRDTVIGVVFVVNGQVTGAEVYGSNALFRKAWPKLLRSAAADAVAEKTDRPTPPAPAAAEVERLLALAGREPANAGAVADGTSNDVVFTGRGAATRGRVLASGGGNPVNPTAAAQDTIIMSGNGAGRVDEQQLRRIADTWSNPPLENRRRATEEQIRQLPPRYRAIVEEYFRQLDRVQQEQAPAQDNIAWGEVPNPEAIRIDATRRAQRPGTAAPVAVNPQGNRLNVNRVEDRAGLVSEARDPARQNAVIHRSFIKK